VHQFIHLSLKWMLPGVSRCWHVALNADGRVTIGRMRLSEDYVRKRIRPAEFRQRDRLVVPKDETIDKRSAVSH
tara:strand:- start:199 stop:420 length:222 start_codon:yes stop_codon:yes gene_type:complete